MSPLPILQRKVISGLFLVDKPKGPTSHDAVLWTRRVLNTKDVGHCGSLDPLATGLLLLVVGEALSQQNRFMAERKVYEGVIRLGSATDTDDLDGRPLAKKYEVDPSAVTGEALRRELAGFEGTLEQEVPTFSAVKVKGKPLYHWARKGVPMERPKKTVQVHRLELLEFQAPDVRFRVECSKGFYVRALARDLGEKLGTGGALAELCREAIGNFQRSDAYGWQDRAELDAARFERSFISIEKLDE